MVVALFMLATLLAQDAAGTLTAEPSFLEGTVLGPDGPLARVEVTAMWDPPPVQFRPDAIPRATTSPDGTFVIQVAPGAYRLTAHIAGFASQWYGAPAPGYDGRQKGVALRLVPGESVRGLTLRLTPAGIVSGRVISPDGQPLVRMQVAVLKRRFAASGFSSLELQGVAETDDRGVYRISGLAPGDYVVAAASLPSTWFDVETSGAARMGRIAPVAPSPGAYGPLYYPAAEDSSRALPVRIRPGTETGNIDFALPRHQLYSIRGRVLDPSTDGPPQRVPTIGIQPAFYEYVTGLAGTRTLRDRPDGSFEINGVGPGTHWVTAQLPAPLTDEQRRLLSTPGADVSQLPRPARGVALVRVADGDVDGVELTIVRNLDLPGSLSVEGERFDFSAESRGFRLELLPVDAAGNGGPAGLASLGSDGKFAFRGLMPTAYRLVVVELPSPFYVKEARLGNIDALAESILLTKPSPAELNVVLARGTQVSGIVTDILGKPLERQAVVLIPDESRQRPDLYRTAVANGDGRFVLDSVAPGDYRVFAWRDVKDFQYFDPNFVGQFQDKGTPVSVLGSTAVEVNVTWIP